MSTIAADIERLATETDFSGAIRIDRGGEVEVEAAYGMASRAYEVPNTPATKIAVASMAKPFTACAVVRLIEEGHLALDLPARSLLRDDLPLIADDVTVEHLLSHRSGIGDYLDEDEGETLDDYPPPPPGLVDTENYVPALDGHPTKFPAGEQFSYCNGGYVVLALLAERASGTPFVDLIQRLVCEPAGMTDTAFLRSDEFPPGTATGYREPDGLRTNVFQVPVRGSGDGGVFTTVGDLAAFWEAFFAGRIVPATWVSEMVRPRSQDPTGPMRYGMGFWLQPVGDVAFVEGYDFGMSCRSVHNPANGTTASVLSNTSEGAWPLVRHLMATLFPID